MFIDNNSAHKQLETEASIFNISLSSTQKDLLLQHLDLLIEKNKVLNLTRITDVESAIRLHIIDSLLVYKVASFDNFFHFLDIGTGGGFPGIPLAIMSNVEGILLDSVAKKVIAVSEFLNVLGLSNRIQVSSDRVEEYAVSHIKEFDLVSARAVAPLASLVEYASPLLSINGKFIAAKAQITNEELTSGIKAAKLCGLKYVSRETYELPSNSGHRELVVFKKMKEPLVKLPRANGMAKNKPLA
ncbi:16S rRNA (guanine(527)-N(7))-methyltransferase RsmG [Atopobium fossor]|uniref:16S rRNA (guanine(527)-N(7))-methyltransferase RsmG n=1 Tax=Atopobium fossor TaxID=39487 RepID=UPI00042348CD|nr:16S rRNA (guanine(527)-N(7))-methyltransferase RsmG [Atopobium fossor]